MIIWKKWWSKRVLKPTIIGILQKFARATTALRLLLNTLYIYLYALELDIGVLSVLTRFELRISAQLFKFESPFPSNLAPFFFLDWLKVLKKLWN